MHRQVLAIERVDERFFIGVKSQPCPTLTSDVAETAQWLRTEPTDPIGHGRPRTVLARYMSGAVQVGGRAVGSTV
jgi:hypothetical protein